MAITLDLSPTLEARLIRQAEKSGVPLNRYIEDLLANPAVTPPPTHETANTSAYLARVHTVLNKFDELPRLKPALSADEIVGFDEWGLPA